MDRKTYLKERKKGIGGSDAPVILLGSHYGKTVVDLFYEKTTEDVHDEIDTPDTRRGKRQEAVAAVVFEEVTGLKLDVVDHIITHPQHTFMRASLDRIVTESDTVVEIKCPRYSTFLKWQREGLPQGIIVQGQHYLCVTDTPKIIYAVYCAETDELLPVTVDRNDELIEMMYQKEFEFWECVEGNTVPELPAPETLDLPAVGGSLVRINTPQWVSVAQRWERIKAIKAEAEFVEAQVKEEIQTLMGENTIVEGAGLRVYWQQQKGRKTLDKAAMKRDGIDIDKYMKEGKPSKPFRPFLLKGDTHE